MGLLEWILLGISALSPVNTNPNNQYLVKTDNLPALQQIVSERNLKIEPLLSEKLEWSDEARSLFGDRYVVQLPQGDDSTFTTIASLPGVQYVEADIIGTSCSIQTPDPNDPLLSEQWGIFKTETNKAWASGFTGNGVKVGINDNGIDTDHEDLTYNASKSYNFWDDNTNVENLDPRAHGTKMSGIVGMIYNNSLGGVGVSPNCDLWIFKCGETAPSHLKTASALIYAADNNVDLVSMSIAFSGLSPILDSALNYAWSKDVFMVGGSGNDGKEGSVYPAAHPYVMSVGATWKNDKRFVISNYGSDVDIFAPGVLIKTTANDGTYEDISGTSAACAFIAGEAALIRQQHPEYTNQQTWDAIINGADTITVDVGTVLRMNTAKAMRLDAITEQPTIPVYDYINYDLTSRSLRYYNAQGVVNVYAINGERVLSRTVEGTGYVSLDNLPSGVYYSRFNCSGSCSGKIETDKCVLYK